MRLSQKSRKRKNVSVQLPTQLVCFVKKQLAPEAKHDSFSIFCVKALKDFMRLVEVIDTSCKLKPGTGEPPFRVVNVGTGLMDENQWQTFQELVQSQRLTASRSELIRVAFLWKVIQMTCPEGLNNLNQSKEEEESQKQPASIPEQFYTYFLTQLPKKQPGSYLNIKTVVADFLETQQDHLTKQEYEHHKRFLANKIKYIVQQLNEQKRIKFYNRGTYEVLEPISVEGIC